MPVVNSVIVPILPDDGERIRAYSNHIADSCGGCIPELDIEYFRIRFGLHVFMPAAAGGAGTRRPQQFKWIDARVIVVPSDLEFSCFFIGSNAGWFFIHIKLRNGVKVFAHAVPTGGSPCGTRLSQSDSNDWSR
jgi:hypothetical protein